MYSTQDIKNNSEKSLIVVPEEKCLWEKCAAFQYKIFVESGYIEENPDKRIPEYDDYKHSLFLITSTPAPNKSTEEINITGAMRLFYTPHADKMQTGIFPSFDLFDKTSLYVEKYEKLMTLDPKEIINIGALTVRKDMRFGSSFSLLMDSFISYCFENRYIYGLAVIENYTLHESLKQLFTLVDLGPVLKFRGAPSILTVIDFYDQLK